MSKFDKFFITNKMINFIDKVIQIIIIMLIGLILLTSYTIIFIRILCSSELVLCRT